MPSPSEQSQSTPTLPSAELNPLLNPLLAENMGRWAEVYFTSPPEKREQAVLELLRELEAKKSGRDVAPASEPGPLPHKAVLEPPYSPSEELPPQRLETQKGIVRCEACGRDNPLSHQFCGMCGAQLESDGSGTQRSEEPQILGTIAQEENPRAQYEPSYDYASGNTNSLSLFQTVGERSYDGSSDWEYEPEPSRPYRIYVGLALAVVILALGYIAWRGAEASQTSQGPPPAPPAASQDAEPAAAPPKTAAEQPQTGSSAPNPTAASKEPSPSKNAEGPAATGSAQAAPAENKLEARRTTPAGRTTEANTQDERTPATASPANGSEELAVAQRYLSGVGGQRRDGAEAAKWLWKSIAKHNGEATLLLADLYLKGDGVPKNCDQARVLLDSAARKGMAGAGERLRNLQAFGCQ